MKKFLLITFMCLFCFGCGKTEKNITINIYENKDTEVKENLTDEDKEKSNIETNFNNTNENIIKEEIEEDTKIEHPNEGVVDNVESNNKTDNWYSKNKDEIKDISKEIIENDVNNINNLIDSAKNWYNDNKEDLKSASDDVISNDKEIISNLLDKFKK